MRRSVAWLLGFGVSVGACPGGSAPAPVDAGEVAAPAVVGEEVAAPAVVGEEVAPAVVGEEAAPAVVDEAAAPAVVGEEAAAPAEEIRDPWLARFADEEEGEGPLWYMARPELEPPRSEVARPFGMYRRSRALVLRRDGVAYAGKVLLPLVDWRAPPGEVERARPLLKEALEGRFYSPLLLVDHRVRYADLIDVLFAVQSGGGVVVRRATDPPGTASGALLLAQPHGADDLPTPATIGLDRRELALYMRITDEVVELGELSHAGDFRMLGRVARAAGWAPVRRIAQEAAARDAADVWGMVVFAAEDDVQLGRVVDALTATSGECGLLSVDRTRCWFSIRIPVGGEPTLLEMSKGRGTLLVEEGERRSRHASGYCSGLVFEDVTSVHLGRAIDEMGDVHDTWLSAAVTSDGEATVRVIPEWRETAWNWQGPDRAIQLSRRSGCRRFAVELRRQPHDSASSKPIFGHVELDCEVGGATVRGRVSFADCATCCD